MSAVLPEIPGIRPPDRGDSRDFRHGLSLHGMHLVQDHVMYSVAWGGINVECHQVQLCGLWNVGINGCGSGIEWGPFYKDSPEFLLPDEAFRV